MRPPRRRYVGKVLAITWDDASYANAQLALDEIAEGFVCDTYGLCVRQTDKGLTLTTDVPHGIEEYRHTSFQPWVLIRNIRVLGEGDVAPPATPIRSA